MRIKQAVAAFYAGVFGFIILSAGPSAAQSATNRDPSPSQQKEWTFLIYLNGHNNLDYFGAMDINEMEKVGSTGDVNVVVQWASSASPKTKRVYVQKDLDPSKVTSPTVQEMPRVDMGDYRSLVEFVRWGVATYPAKKYFIAVWDHGSGWHAKKRGQLGITPQDISWDDFSGNHMTTKQLGQAMTEAAQIIGHKVDVYGSDACLMAMAEVAGEMMSSVEVFVGSQELEPGKGWPYDGLLSRWTARPGATARDVGKYLVEEYVKSYQGGSQGNDQVTLSAFDLTQMPGFNAWVKELGEKLSKLDASERAKVVSAARGSINFTYDDYVDLMDFVSNVQKAGISTLDSDLYRRGSQSFDQFVYANGVTASYARAKGLSLWIPQDMSTYNRYIDLYRQLGFQAETGWADSLRAVLQ